MSTLRPPAATLRKALRALCLAAALFGGPVPGAAAKQPAPSPAALRPADVRGPVPLERAVASYWIEARLDPEDKAVRAGATLRWTNRTRRTVSELPFHLYMNAFRAEDTAWMRSSSGSHRGIRPGKELDWGYVDVWTVQMVEGDSVVDVPFAEDEDPSLMMVRLPRPVGPGETVELRYTFETKLPRVFARTGYADDFFMVAQWFPKIAVLEEAGGWKAHVFTLNDEFYADFGNYDVILDVPEDMVVGATGVRVSETSAEGRKRIRQRAEMVHDFAWTAYADFEVHEGTYEGIQIRQLLPKDVDDAAAEAEAHLAVQKLALRSFEDRYGPYPWSSITIVHPPSGASGAGGMEYPTLYTTSPRIRVSPWLRAHVFDERVSGLFTTVHEFGHQYFQGLFASNEHEQAWLDEGLNTMADLLAYEDAYGRGTENDWMIRFLGHRLPIDGFVRLSLGRAGDVPLAPIDQPASFFPAETGTYGVVTYSKTAAAMLTLRRLVGDAAFRRAVSAYVERARFAHPTGDDLQRAFEDTLGREVVLFEGDDRAGPVVLDLSRYFEQMRYDVSLPDVRVAAIRHRRLPGTAGFHRGGDGTLEETPLPENFADPLQDLPDEELEAVVVVERPGDFEVPVEVLVVFEEGDPVLTWWDGRDRHRIFRFPGRRVRYAAVDPHHRILLETRRLDNTRYARRSDGPRALSEMVGRLAEALSYALVLGGVP